MILAERRDPGGQVDVHAADRKFAEQQRENAFNVRRRKLGAVDQRHRHAVLLLERPPKCLRLVAVRRFAVEQQNERLAALFHLGDDLFLDRGIACAGQLADRTVGADHHADRGMLAHDLLGAEPRRRREFHLFLAPRRVHQPRLAVFLRAERPLHGEAHAVHHAQVHVQPARGLQMRAALGDELRLGGHHGLAACRLRQLVACAGARVLVRDVRQHHFLHEPLDKGGFARPHRTDDPDIDVALRPLCDVLVNTASYHARSSVWMFSLVLII